MQPPFEICLKLAAWFKVSARILPWRESFPRDPYRVWVSEVMLQQTRVSAVIGYFNRFMSRFPTVSDLANADESEVFKLWEGLGYYSRAKNLHKAAKTVVCQYGGQFPSDYESLRTLSGVGDYTAGAIASICFNLPCPAVDGNVLRVITRLTGNFSDIQSSATKQAVINALLPLYEQANNRSVLTESLMELGATVCVPNASPKCGECPLSEHCKAYKENLTEQIPVKSKKPARAKEDYTVFIVKSEGRFAVQKRPAAGLLAGLWEFLNCIGFLDERQAAAFLKARGFLNFEFIMRKNAKHVFTHKEWHMNVYYLKSGTVDCVEWKTLNEITLPSAFKKLIL